MIQPQQAVETFEADPIEETLEEFVLKTLGVKEATAVGNPLSKRMEDAIKVSVLRLQKLLSKELNIGLQLGYQNYFWEPQEVADLLNARQFENGLAITFKNRDRRFHVFLPAELVYQLSALVLNSPVSAILAEPTNKESTAICFLIAKILSESAACKGIYLCSSIILSGKENSKEFSQFLSAQCLGNKTRGISVSVLLEEVSHQVLIYADVSLLAELQEEESRKLAPSVTNSFLRSLKTKYKIKINIQAGLLANLFNLQNGQVWKLNLGQSNSLLDNDHLTAGAQLSAMPSLRGNSKLNLPVELLSESMPGKLALKFQTNNQPTKESL
jgi:hypothetical protein